MSGHCKKTHIYFSWFNWCTVNNVSPFLGFQRQFNCFELYANNCVSQTCCNERHKCCIIDSKQIVWMHSSILFQFFAERFDFESLMDIEIFMDHGEVSETFLNFFSTFLCNIGYFMQFRNDVIGSQPIENALKIRWTPLWFHILFLWMM